jgi:F-type H+/Na+-transporting ATPase subunit alpha
VLKQPQFAPLSVAQQVSILFAANNGVLDNIDGKKIQSFKEQWFTALSAKLPQLEAKLNAGDKLAAEEEKSLMDALVSFRDQAFVKE